MKKTLVKLLLFALVVGNITGCISMAMERSTGHLQSVAMSCVQAPSTAVTIYDRQDSVSQVTWTARAGTRTCTCVARTISETPGQCVLVSEGK